MEEAQLQLTRVHGLLAQEGRLISHSSLYPFPLKWGNCGRSSLVTVRRLDRRSGASAEVHIGRLQYPQGLGNASPRVVHSFATPPGYSRMSCIAPAFRQDLVSVIRCFEAMAVLPDGPFKLFFFLSLNADRQTERLL